MPLGLAALLLAAAAPAAAQEQVSGLGGTELFEIAAQAEREERIADAEALYVALAADPDPEIRAEARFRQGMMLGARGRHTDAAVLMRQLLDEKPDALRVRLELARILALIGDEGAARRELRQVRAGGLPADVALVVDQFAGALRARKPWGGSFSVALAPDSNINRATDSRTLDTVIAPLDLSEEAQQQSGVGLKLGGQAYARLPLGNRVSLLPRLSSQAELYRASRYNDVSGSALLGVEVVLGRARVRPSLGATWRSYGGDAYARTRSASVNWVQAAGSRAQFDTDLSASRADYVLNDLQDGWLYDFGTRYERAFDARSGGSLSLSLNRQTARDPGYATRSGGAGLLYWRELGRMTLYGSANLRRLKADARLLLFPERRTEWLYRAELGATFRQATVAGFAPLARASLERNASTVGLYDYRRTAFEFGVTRAF